MAFIMNAHSPITLERGSLAGKLPDVPTPIDLEITVRDLRFGRGEKSRRWWLGGDPVGTAWFNALSATFPRGEAFFVESVRAYRDTAPAHLAEAIRSFIKQEVNHSREHVVFNKAAVDAGYKIDHIETRMSEMLDLARGRPPVVNLAATMALEHFTAIFAHQLLASPRFLAGADPHIADLWRWHAIEEIEHKAVAYDTFLFATQGWSRRRRWKVKALSMFAITQRFIANRYRDTLDLLAQDGITGWKARARVLWYLAGSPGLLRVMLPGWIAYFLPGFHPWNHDDRGLIAGAEAGLAQAG